MKRTPWWVFVAAVGVQLAALGLCVWAMDYVRRRAEEDRTVLAGAQPAPDPIYVPVPEPAPEPEERPAAGPEEPVPPAEPPASEPPQPVTPPRPRAVVRAVQPLDRSPVPRFGPPPERPAAPPDPDAVPSFISEMADATTQIVRGRSAQGRFAFGFYPDGNIRFVDVDGGRYAGKLESARARMREADGMRAFTVQIGVAADRRLQASFTGGPHEGQTVLLEPLPGWSVA